MIRYKKGYKYQLVEDAEFQTNVRPHCDIVTPYITLTTFGILRIRSGYAWDGPSGPTFDTKTFMQGSLVHDAIYQLMREGFLDKSFKVLADEELGRICKEDGMWSFRAAYVEWAVKTFAYKAMVSNRDILQAP